MEVPLTIEIAGVLRPSLARCSSCAVGDWTHNSRERGALSASARAPVTSV
jgi:hypothetical protein